jgi:triosephosphate isomerase
MNEQETRHTMRKKLVAGNWKMHGSHSANAELLSGILAARPFACDVAVCVPFPYLSEAAVALAGSDVRWGAQDCSAHDKGAYTGEVSAAMLAEFGCRYVIVGHSERRAMHGETDQLVADKAKAVLARGLTPIVCVGETLGQREQGTAQATVKRQLSAVIHALGHCVGEMVVAYARAHPRATAGRHGARRRHADPLRRQHEARQRRRAAGATRHRWRTGRRRGIEGGRLRRHLPRGLTAANNNFLESQAKCNSGPTFSSSCRSCRRWP